MLSIKRILFPGWIWRNLFPLRTIRKLSEHMDCCRAKKGRQDQIEGIRFQTSLRLCKYNAVVIRGKGHPCNAPVPDEIHGSFIFREYILLHTSDTRLFSAVHSTDNLNRGTHPRG